MLSCTFQVVQPEQSLQPVPTQKVQRILHLLPVVLQISSDMRQAKKTISALVQQEAPARRATAFCLFSA